KRAERRYRTDTMVLETQFETDSGVCRLVDFMPIEAERESIIRLVQGIEGEVRLRMELVVRFDYGDLVPWVTRGEDELVAISGRDRLVLRTPADYRGEGLRTIAEFDVRAGTSVPFTLCYSDAVAPPLPSIDPARALSRTEHYWRNWA